MKKVFFDASVLFSALYSTNGASSALLSLVSKQIIGITTETCIEELERNIDKINEDIRYNISDLIAKSQLIIRKTLTQQEQMPYIGLVDKKDVHVLAGAIITNCDYLVTLDRKHLDNEKIKKRIKSIFILSPRKLLFEILLR